MSGISGVGSSSSSLYPLSTTGNADAADGVSTGASDLALTVASQDSGSSDTSTTSPLGDLRNQLETAVTNAVNQLPADSSPQDIFNAIHGAVQDTLKANGIDPQQITGQRHGGHHHHHAHAASGGSGASAGNDGDADDQQNDANPLTAPGSTSADALVTLLQQLTGNDQTQGTSAGQPTDLVGAIGGTNTGTQTNPLLSALQNNNGGVNLTNIFVQLFQGFPHGTGLDVQA